MSQAKTRSLMSMRKVVEKKVARKRGNTLDNGTNIDAHDTENFLESIVRVLLRSRYILATSYGIGYLIPDERKEAREAHDTLQVTFILSESIVIFFTQGKLEEVVENLAQMVNRPYLNTPRTDMASRARDVSFICQEFTEVMRDVVLSGLTEEPPAPLPPPIPDEEEIEINIDPLVLFAHFAMRNDPQFREIFNRLMAQQQDDN